MSFEIEPGNDPSGFKPEGITVQLLSGINRRDELDTVRGTIYPPNHAGFNAGAIEIIQGAAEGSK